MGLGQTFNQNSGLMNNSSFNMLFGNQDESTNGRNSMMVESGDKRNFLIIEKFAIPNLGPQDTHYADLRRNLSNYNRTRNTDSDLHKHGTSYGSNDSLSNLQKDFRDIRLSNSQRSSGRITPDQSDEGRNSSGNWVDKLTINEESFNKNQSGSNFN